VRVHVPPPAALDFARGRPSSARISPRLILAWWIAVRWLSELSLSALALNTVQRLVKTTSSAKRTRTKPNSLRI
jgi:hypothetical protein